MAYKIQTPGNYPEENTQHTEHGESLKSSCKVLIALPLQQLLHERSSLLRYTYTACLIITDAENIYCAVRTGL